MDKFAAQLSAIAYVVGQRLEARNQRGQTTAEYVGIVAFVAVLAFTVIGLAGGFGGKVTEIVNAAFDKIKSGLG